MTGQSEHQDRLVAVNTEAHNYYREQLLTSPTAQGPCRYLTHRRLAHLLTADSPWSVGYAPAGWTNLTGHLHKTGFTDQELIAAGVACRTRHGGIVDRFRDRIMLAHRDHNGDVVGFVGRAAPGAPSDAPKYLNSPHTDIYNKRELLYGLFENSHSIRYGSRPVLMEGPFDVLALATACHGTDLRLSGLAPCGTALTREQVDLFARQLPPGVDIVTAYDNDQAGRAATAAAYELLSEHIDVSTHRLLAPVLPRGTDPAELLQVHGPAALRHGLSHVEPLVKRAIEARLEPWAPVLDGIDGRVAAAKTVAPLIARLPQAQVATHLVDLADRLYLDPVTVSIAITDALTATEPSDMREGSDRSRPRTNKSPPPPRNSGLRDAGLTNCSVESHQPLTM